MTWGKALPKIAVAAVFDVLAVLCNFFWFFGPALAAFLCTYAVSSDSSIATALGGIGCTAGATAVGIAGSPIFITVGVVLAMAVGLIGWLTVGLWLLLTNDRIFRANTLWFASSLLAEEVPLLNALPLLTGILIRMYATQIRSEEAAFKKYQAERARREALRQAQEALSYAQETDARNSPNEPVSEERKSPEEPARTAS